MLFRSFASVVDEPSPEPKLSPFEKKEMKEVVVNEFSSSGDNAQPDTSEAPLTQLPAEEVVDAPQCSDSFPTEESSTFDKVRYCQSCDQDYAYYAYLNSLNRPSRHYVPDSRCAECDTDFQKGPYWGHRQNRDGAMCKYKGLKFFQECVDR